MPFSRFADYVHRDGFAPWSTDDPYILFQPDLASPFLILGDHASNHVPADVDLAIATHLLDEHIASDPGVAPVAAELGRALGCPAMLGGISRLVIDYNRELDRAGLIPESSDGYAIPGNQGLCVEAKAMRIRRYWQPYHAELQQRIEATQPALLISLHSFTPQLSTHGQPRPWQVGILYNQDSRAAAHAISFLEQQGLCVGDNLPYSGKDLNATMNVHAEARNIPYITFEMRQDMLVSEADVREWADLLHKTVLYVADKLGIETPR